MKDRPVIRSCRKTTIDRDPKTSTETRGPDMSWSIDHLWERNGGGKKSVCEEGGRVGFTFGPDGGPG